MVYAELAGNIGGAVLAEEEIGEDLVKSAAAPVESDDQPHPSRLSDRSTTPQAQSLHDPARWPRESRHRVSTIDHELAPGREA